MRRLPILALTAVLTAGFAAAAAAQAPRPPATYESTIVNSWKNVHNKILTMAKDTQFPDAKLGWKPHPDSRSVLDELRHVTIGLEMTTAVAKGEKFDFEAREKADACKPKTRASMVAEMEAAIAASFPMVEAKQSPSLIGWLEHQGEHYGKLVTAYRVNGIVPPVSRPKRTYDPIVRRVLGAKCAAHSSTPALLHSMHQRTVRTPGTVRTVRTVLCYGVPSLLR